MMDTGNKGEKMDEPHCRRGIRHHRNILLWNDVSIKNIKSTSNINFTDMEIKVLGPGCAKCKSTYNVIEKVVKENHLDVKLTKVEDIIEMMNYNIMTTPAVVVDEVVKMKGKVPTKNEVKQLLGI